ncbi:MAG: hypothetical protein ACFFC7_20290 [Candidatus Hermodarchaeota archaeon]
MAGFLPFIVTGEVYLLSGVVLAIITILIFYRYIELRRLSDLVISIGFLLLTVYMIERSVFLILGTEIFSDFNLGGLRFIIFLLAFIVLLIGMIVQVRGGE